MYKEETLVLNFNKCSAKGGLDFFKWLIQTPLLPEKTF